jgi:DNA processing protein
MDRGLLDLIIGRIPKLSSSERVLLCEHFNGEAELRGLSKGDVESLVGRSLRIRWNLDELRAQAERDEAVMGMRDIALVSCVEAGYPPLLREISDPPALLFYRGRLPDPEKPLVAMVGTRRPSGAALGQAYDLAGELARAGLSVVSGLALGIDAMSHRGCLEGGAPTYGVLGSGLDEVYPGANRMLARRIVEQGGALLSEYPPGTGARKWHFPARNRIISGLSRGTVIVEAPLYSGALITARFALEQDRDLWVGSAGCGSSLGEGTRKLAGDGAPIIENGAAILREWGIDVESGVQGVQGAQGGAEQNREAFSPAALADSLARALKLSEAKFSIL